VRPGLALPDKTSVAVLPFANLSRDPAQEYFGDRVAEDLITGLSKVSGLFVIARNSVFTYKGQAVKVSDVGRDLGVRLVLESGIQRASGSPPSSSMPPPNTTSGPSATIGKSAISALQDKVTQQIVRALAVKLAEGEQGRITRVPTGNLDAYDLVLRGQDERRTIREGYSEARQLLVKGPQPRSIVRYSLRAAGLGSSAELAVPVEYRSGERAAGAGAGGASHRVG
jgi:TolB-like protein